MFLFVMLTYVSFFVLFMLLFVFLIDFSFCDIYICLFCNT